MAKIAPANTTFTTALAAGFTHAQFVSWLKTNFTACGFPTVNEQFSGGETTLAYDINFDNTFTYGRVAFLVRVPVITNGANFTVETGLCHHANYNFTTFQYTNTRLNAGGAVSNVNDISTTDNFTFNNNNGYQCLTLPIGLELVGLFVTEVNNFELMACLGMYIPENVFSNYDRNQNSYISLLRSEFLDNAISTFINTNVGTAIMSLAPPFLGVNQFSGNFQQIEVSNFLFLPAPDGFASDEGTNGKYEIVTCSTQVAFFSENTVGKTKLFGFASEDLKGGYGVANFGDIIEEQAGVEEYLVLFSKTSGNITIVLVIQIDL